MNAPRAGPPDATPPGRPTPPRASHANPFDVSGPYAGLMRLALGLALVPGLGVGLLLVAIAGLRLPWSVAWPQLAQGHGQVQALGFTLLFIIAVALQLFPRFLAAPLRHPGRALQGGILVALAVVARLIAQPLEPGLVRGGLLLLAALGVPAGALLAGSAFHGLSRQSLQPAHGPAASWRRFVAVGGLALGGALVLHTWVVLGLLVGGVMAPTGPNEALIHLALAGFATCLVFGVASRVFGRFLLLSTRPGLESSLPGLAAAYGLGLTLVALGWLADAPWSAWVRFGGALLETAVLLYWLWLVGLYNQPSRASGTPYVTNPTRRWVRFAFGFLVFGLASSAFLYGREALVNVVPRATELSAARHALAQGFLLVLMVSMAVRLLPILSADVLRHRWLPELMVDLLLAGALLRVGAEMIGGYAGAAGPLLALGGTLGVVGFTIFAAAMWSSLGRLPRSVPAATG